MVVGGGLFPRTALLLREYLPDCRIIVLETNPDHLELARNFLGPDVELVRRHYQGDELPGCDLAVVPLAFRGDRASLYRRPPARHLLVHDWWWRPTGRTAGISVFLLKRLHLVTA